MGKWVRVEDYLGERGTAVETRDTAEDYWEQKQMLWERRT